jgi:hypothetical protein
MSESDAQERIDAALDAVLRASGSALRYYTMPSTLAAMREAMRNVMSESYISGANDMHRVTMIATSST